RTLEERQSEVGDGEELRGDADHVLVQHVRLLPVAAGCAGSSIVLHSCEGPRVGERRAGVPPTARRSASGSCSSPGPRPPRVGCSSRLETTISDRCIERSTREREIGRERARDREGGTSPLGTRSKKKSERYL